MRAALTACERAIPRGAKIDEYLQEQAADVVLFTPLIGLVASPQLDYLQSAKALGYPTALCVWSWDHLSSKAILRNVPDRIFVWNETQRNEALTLHGVRPEQSSSLALSASTSGSIDARQPTERRSAGRSGWRATARFCCTCAPLFSTAARARRFSSNAGSRQVRTCGLEPLASIPIVVRPHPARLKEWADVNVTEDPGVRLWGRNPVDPDAKADYFDSLHHSAAVVGLNTSAFLEGAIAGKPVFTTLLPEHYENQEGTIHFHYLLNVGGGLLHTAKTLDEQCRQLNAALQATEQMSPKSRRFVEAFIRPRGTDVPASPVFADAVEALRGVSRVAGGEQSSHRVLRGVMAPVVSLASRRVAEPLMLSEHERAIVARQRAHREHVDAAWRVKDAHNLSEQQQRDARVAERARYKAERAAEWRRTKTMKRFKQRLMKRIGLIS